MYFTAPPLTMPTVGQQATPPEGWGRSFWRFGLANFIFGFYDNFIMVAAGEQIDSMFGSALGQVVKNPETQTFAAAGLGNTLSDAFGVGIADRLVSGLARMGGPMEILQPKGIANDDGAFWGKLTGITTGCLAGLVTALAAQPAGWIGSIVGIPAVLLYSASLPPVTEPA